MRLKAGVKSSLVYRTTKNRNKEEINTITKHM